MASTVGLRVLAIGDTHFRASHLEQGEDLVSNLLRIARKERPDLIVLLGDTLHDFDVVSNLPFQQACRLILGLGDIAETYVIIGNHDLINSSQYLTSNHFFGYLNYDRVHVIDYPALISIKRIPFVFCPFTPPGRFVETLDDTLGRKFWTKAKCIFTHQDLTHSRESIPGRVQDWWDPLEYPSVISGHIHTPYSSKNIHYPGSAIQVNFGEAPNKRVWLVTFERNVPGMRIRKIPTGVKGKSELVLPLVKVTRRKVDSILILSKESYIKLKVECTVPQFNAFKKSVAYKSLLSAEVVVVRAPERRVASEAPESRVTPERKSTYETKSDKSKTKTNKAAPKVKSLEELFREIVYTKSKDVVRAYEETYETSPPKSKKIIT